jgi:APA family basic amino acid/polyamine antiporter
VVERWGKKDEPQAGYQSVLVAFENDQYVPSVVRTAMRLAARRRRGIHVLVTITVPTTAAIDAPMPAAEAAAQAIVDSARVLGGRRVTGHWEKVRPGQSGRRIVDTARALEAGAIVAPRPERRAGLSLFGRTLETVLEERPCRVIIESAPGAERRSNE